MKTLHLLIIIILFSFLTLIATKFSEGCLLNSDWPHAPCYAIPGLDVTKEQMQKDWSGYYMYKGSQWMEMKKIEMINATASGILKAWVCSSQSNYDAWWYYYLNGQAQSIAWPTNGPMCTIPPLQQLKVGAKISEVECGYDLYLLVNKENGMPACVKLASITKLLGLGWEHIATYLDDTAPHSPITTKISITEQDFTSCKLCEGKSENLTVAIGANNTVRWVNNTPSPVWFLALPNDDDIAFSNSAIFPLGGHIGTMKFPAYLYNGQSFEYTFTKPGKFFWHTNPQFMGWVTVLPEPSENLNDIFLSPSNKMLNKTDCIDPKFFNMFPTLTQEKQQTAITLAERSKIFQENTLRVNYTVINVAPNYSFDPKTCSNVTINAVTVGFKLSNGSSLGIYEDGSISKVTGANKPRVIHGHPTVPSLP